MYSLDPNKMLLSKSKTGRLLGLTRRDLDGLRKLGTGPDFLWTSRSIVYAAHYT